MNKTPTLNAKPTSCTLSIFCFSSTFRIKWMSDVMQCNTTAFLCRLFRDLYSKISVVYTPELLKTSAYSSNLSVDWQILIYKNSHPSFEKFEGSILFRIVVKPEVVSVRLLPFAYKTSSVRYVESLFVHNSFRLWNWKVLSGTTGKADLHFGIFQLNVKNWKIS